MPLWGPGPFCHRAGRTGRQRHVEYGLVVLVRRVPQGEVGEHVQPELPGRQLVLHVDVVEHGGPSACAAGNATGVRPSLGVHVLCQRGQAFADLAGLRVHSPPEMGGEYRPRVAGVHLETWTSCLQKGKVNRPGCSWRCPGCSSELQCVAGKRGGGGDGGGSCGLTGREQYLN